jgi:signal transduction histidine kinase
VTVTDQVLRRLADLEAVIARRSDLSDDARAELAGRVTALRGSLERQREADQEERQRLGHDLRAPLNAIAGWAHILRLDAAAGANAVRAADVFDRNVRALTGLIETYTTPVER